MGFAILRTQKLKHPIAIARSLKHAFRAQNTPNADPGRTPNNTVIGASSVGAGMQRFNERLATQPKIRSNAVLAIEYLIAASPEDIHSKSRGEQDAYFADALKWIEEKHGAENVIAAGIHRDETSPHMYLLVVPLDKRGKLNCRAFLGGADALRQMQTEFAERVGRPHGLQRGIEGSKARHTTIKQYYARANAAFEPLPEQKTPSPKPLREKPTKPGVFAGREANDKYELDMRKWQLEEAAHLKQLAIRKQERTEMLEAALSTARRHEAQASETKVYKARWSEMHDMNAYLSRSARKSKAEVEAMRNILALFTPEEIKTAQERGRVEKSAHERLTQLDTQKQLETLEIASREAAEERRSKEIQQEQAHRQKSPRDTDQDLDF